MFSGRRLFAAADLYLPNDRCDLLLALLDRFLALLEVWDLLEARRLFRFEERRAAFERRGISRCEVDSVAQEKKTRDCNFRSSPSLNFDPFATSQTPRRVPHELEKHPRPGVYRFE